MRCPILLTIVALLSAALCAQDPNGMRVILDFENGSDGDAVRRFANSAEFDIVQDNGVTRGKNCCRVLTKAGDGWANFELRGELIKGWDAFDYVALDVFTERTEKIPFALELLDSDSKNYQTRCTFEGTQLHQGRNTLLWRIDRAKRNKAEGREWHELTPAEKIRRNALTAVRFIISPPKEGGTSTVMWIDNLRLLSEDAAVPKLNIELPADALAFDFGPKGTAVAKFQQIGATSPGVKGAGIKEVGKGWPDPLTGDGLESSTPFTFELPVPDGEYNVWISAGKVLNEATRTKPFTLTVGDQSLCDESLSLHDFYGEKGLFRHLRTQYSNRPHALWLDYVLPVAPEQTAKVKVSGGALNIQVSNHRLSALILLPVAREAEFTKLTASLRDARIKFFESSRYADVYPSPKPQAGDGAYAFWQPKSTATIRPWSSPEAQLKSSTLDWKGVPGQRLTARICVTAFEDLGTGELSLSDLKGPKNIPASQIRTYFQNYRVADTSVDELALLPWTKIRFEAGLTWSYVLWLEIPLDAPAGDYRGTATFTPAKGGTKSIPVQLEVYPFKLLEALPLSLGMYYSPWNFPEGYDRRKLILEQHRFMRELGFTGTTLGGGNVENLSGDGTVNLRVDPFLFDIAKEAGLGRTPHQYSMGSTLGMARTIARRLGLSPQVDQNPGCEFQKKELKGLYQDAIKKFAAYIQQSGVPVALESVDEPREHPNPWNRNVEQTNTYADWIKASCSLPVFVTPMSDENSGKDYTSLSDHHDILSVHAWPASTRTIAKSQEQKKTLWFYNTGMDRLSWGFYSWKMNAVGRWEWHWAADGLVPADGYPCENDAFTPFTGGGDLALRAPYASFPGGFAFKSAFLSASEGISDYAYLLTLESAIAAAGGNAAKAQAVKDAQAFLDSLRKSIPQFPGIKNMSAADAGALVGAGLDTPVAEFTPAWRAKIGELLRALK